MNCYPNDDEKMPTIQRIKWWRILGIITCFAPWIVLAFIVWLLHH